jgi:hypothetical protein
MVMSRLRAVKDARGFFHGPERCSTANARYITTPRGRHWYPKSVSNLLAPGSSDVSAPNEAFPHLAIPGGTPMNGLGDGGAARDWRRTYKGLFLPISIRRKLLH